MTQHREKSRSGFGVSAGMPNTDMRLPAALRNRAGWSRLFDAKRDKEPHLHQIEPTNHCIFACIMCPRKKMTREVGYIDLGLFRRVINEVAAYGGPSRNKEIELFHFGESLFHPELHTMTAYASERDLKTVLSLNPPELAPDTTCRLLEARPYKIILSQDGIGTESYREMRGDAAKLDRALSAIDTLLAERQRLGVKTRLVIRMIRLNRNIEETERFEAFWQGRGLETEIREFFPWGDPEMQELGPYRRYPTGMPCPFPWQHLVVQRNGDVVPCCRDYDATVKLGSVRDNSLTEIWNSDAYETFRETHRTGRYGDNRTCENCMKLYYTPEQKP